MDNLFLKFDLGKAPFTLNYDANLLFLGSCFSEEISSRANYYGFHSYSNPLGTVFHPLPLARFLLACTQNKGKCSRLNIVFRSQDFYYSWDANTQLKARSVNEIQTKLNEICDEWRKYLMGNAVLIITLGTAWGYRLPEGLVVANCHKQPNDQFRKEITDIDLLENEWRAVLFHLSQLNPDLKIVFTVSPVRHIRDGLIENNQSKAVLIELVRRLTSATNATYFPAFEIIIDQLRDYRFYKLDRVHPSEEAVSIVWENFIRFYLDDSHQNAVKEVERYRKFVSHVPIHTDQVEIEKHSQKCARMLSELKEKIPNALL